MEPYLVTSSTSIDCPFNWKVRFVGDVNFYTILSDFILALHFAFVSFIVGGFVVIWIGHCRSWSFVRNFGFRLAHLLAMAFVLAESLVGIVCPLTTWENVLRRRANQGESYTESFIQHWLQRILFYDVSEQTLTLIYTAFFVLMVLTVWLVPPRRRR